MVAKRSLRMRTASLPLIAALVSPVMANPPLPACGAGLKYIFAFGDSYTTTAFNISLTKPTFENPIGNPAYPGITTANGTNWADDLVSNICANETLLYNFAAGGASVDTSNPAPPPYYIPPFRDQVQTYASNLSSHPPYASDWTSNNSIATIWFGANDMSSAYFGNMTAAQFGQHFLNGFYPPLDRLYTTGLRDFLLFTAPPTYRLPFYIGLDQQDIDRLQNFMYSINDGLTSIARNWSKTYPDANIAIVNITKTFDRASNDPSQFGAPDATCTDTGLGCLWAGSFHPGTAIQSAVAKLVNQTLASNAVTSSGVTILPPSIACIGLLIAIFYAFFVMGY